MLRKIYRFFAGWFSLLVMILLAWTLSIQYALPDRFFIPEGERFELLEGQGFPSVLQTVRPVSALQSAAPAGSSYQVDLKLFGTVSVKNVQVEVVPKTYVIPSGSPFGIKMFTEGVMVVGMTDVLFQGQTVNPAKEAGIHTGDMILKVDGCPVSTNEEMAEQISCSNGKPVELLVKRKESVFTVKLTPRKGDNSDFYRAGIWVRDSSAGIGTLTFLDPANHAFAGLGHAVCDVDTGELMPLSTGEIVDVHITGVTKGESGRPGELRGSFTGQSAMGTLQINCETGVFGFTDSHALYGNPVPLAMRQEVKPGPATIYTTTSGNVPQEYQIVIERVTFGETNPTKNMVIKITDPKLLQETGGIVQGMSGSPILQDGKLVGAVTHVFVNDPTKGYGIFAENMENTIQQNLTVKSKAA